MSDELTPITRKETFLAKAGGQNVVTPTPITREETFLQAIIDNGSGGGGGGGVLVCTLNMQTMALDKTWNEINNADYCVAVSTMNGKDFSLLGSIYDDGGSYYVMFVPLWGETFMKLTFEASSADGYPIMQM